MTRRGFTLIELMISIALTSVFAGAIGAFYLEARATAATHEAQIALERRASLSLERLARDLRSGRVTHSEAGLVVERPEGTVRWRIEAGRLERRAGEARRVLARGASDLRLEPAEGGHTVHLTLTRRITRTRRLRIRRAVFVGDRR